MSEHHVTPPNGYRAMMPAKRMRTKWSLVLSPWALVRSWSTSRRLNQLVDAFRLVERFADGEPRAHAFVELARAEQLVMPSVRRDPPTVEHQNLIRIPYGG